MHTKWIYFHSKENSIFYSVWRQIKVDIVCKTCMACWPLQHLYPYFFNASKFSWFPWKYNLHPRVTGYYALTANAMTRTVLMAKLQLCLYLEIAGNLLDNANYKTSITWRLGILMQIFCLYFINVMSFKPIWAIANRPWYTSNKIRKRTEMTLFRTKSVLAVWNSSAKLTFSGSLFWS